MKAIKFFTFASAALLFAACEPAVLDKTELGEVPTVDYTLTYVDTNNITLTTQSSGDPFLYQWDIEGVGTFSGETVDVLISKMGTYNITHRAFNQGGHGEATGTVEILADAPLDCSGAGLFLTDCGSRVWKMEPVEGAYWVGPVDGSSTWWANTAADVGVRTCAFDDEWTFNSNAEMIYDTKGDIWAETYMGVAADGCNPETVLAGTKTPWGSGTHAFEIIPDAGVAGLGQLKVNGLGAFIGLPKATNVGEVSDPVASITYDILSMTDDGTARRMQVEVNFGGGLWRFYIYSEL